MMKQEKIYKLISPIVHERDIKAFNYRGDDLAIIEGENGEVRLLVERERFDGVLKEVKPFLAGNIPMAELVFFAPSIVGDSEISPFGRVIIYFPYKDFPFVGKVDENLKFQDFANAIRKAQQKEDKLSMCWGFDERNRFASYLLKIANSNYNEAVFGDKEEAKELFQSLYDNKVIPEYNDTDNMLGKYVDNFKKQIKSILLDNNKFTYEERTAFITKVAVAILNTKKRRVYFPDSSIVTHKNQSDDNLTKFYFGNPVDNNYLTKAKMRLLAYAGLIKRIGENCIIQVDKNNNLRDRMDNRPLPLPYKQATLIDTQNFFMQNSNQEYNMMQLLNMDPYTYYRDNFDDLFNYAIKKQQDGDNREIEFVVPLVSAWGEGMNTSLLQALVEQMRKEQYKNIKVKIIDTTRETGGKIVVNNRQFSNWRDYAVQNFGLDVDMQRRLGMVDYRSKDNLEFSTKDKKCYVVMAGDYCTWLGNEAISNNNNVWNGSSSEALNKKTDFFKYYLSPEKKYDKMENGTFGFDKTGAFQVSFQDLSMPRKYDIFLPYEHEKIEIEVNEDEVGILRKSSQLKENVLQPKSSSIENKAVKLEEPGLNKENVPVFKVNLNINGVRQTIQADYNWTLLQFLKACTNLQFFKNKYKNKAQNNEYSIKNDFDIVYNGHKITDASLTAFSNGGGLNLAQLLNLDKNKNNSVDIVIRDNIRNLTFNLVPYFKELYSKTESRLLSEAEAFFQNPTEQRFQEVVFSAPHLAVWFEYHKDKKERDEMLKKICQIDSRKIGPRVKALVVHEYYRCKYNEELEDDLEQEIRYIMSGTSNANQISPKMRKKFTSVYSDINVELMIERANANEARKNGSILLGDGEGSMKSESVDKKYIDNGQEKQTNLFNNTTFSQEQPWQVAGNNTIGSNFVEESQHQHQADEFVSNTVQNDFAVKQQVPFQLQMQHEDENKQLEAEQNNDGILVEDESIRKKFQDELNRDIARTIRERRRILTIKELKSRINELANNKPEYKSYEIVLLIFAPLVGIPVAIVKSMKKSKHERKIRKLRIQLLQEQVKQAEEQAIYPAVNKQHAVKLANQEMQKYYPMLQINNDKELLSVSDYYNGKSRF